MNAFDEAIDRIDDINAPEKIKPTMIKTFEYFSKYFEEILWSLSFVPSVPSVPTGIYTI